MSFGLLLIFFPHSWAMRAIIWLLFALVAAFPPFSYRFCRPFYFLNSYVSVLALRTILFLILFTSSVLSIYSCFYNVIRLTWPSLTYFLILLFCLLRLSFFPVGFFVYFQLIRQVFHLALYLGYASGFLIC